MRRAALLALALLTTACAGAPAPAPDRAHLAHPEPASGDARVHTYTSTRRGFATHSYVIEGPTGLVLIDAQFLPSAALDVVERAEAATGKEVELAVVLHANPDKFNGTKVLQDRGVEVVTSAQVAALIPDVHALRTRWFFDRYKPDYPAELPAPTVFGDATRTLEAGGTTLTAHVLGGPGCSEAHVAVTWEGHLFVGDLVSSQNHAWMELGHLDAWKARLTELRALNPRFVHPGRGPSGGPDLLDAQTAYLDHVLELVRAEQPTGEPDDAAVQRVAAKLRAAHPGYGQPYFLQVGLPAVFRVVAKGR